MCMRNHFKGKKTTMYRNIVSFVAKAPTAARHTSSSGSSRSTREENLKVRRSSTQATLAGRQEGRTPTGSRKGWTSVLFSDHALISTSSSRHNYLAELAGKSMDIVSWRALKGPFPRSRSSTPPAVRCAWKPGKTLYRLVSESRSTRGCGFVDDIEGLAFIDGRIRRSELYSLAVPDRTSIRPDRVSPFRRCTLKADGPTRWRSVLREGHVCVHETGSKSLAPAGRFNMNCSYRD